MKAEGLPPYLRDALRRYGVHEFYPPQAEALRKGLLDGRRLMVSTPTASGKTLLALMAAYKHVAEGGKVLYLTPLRALAAEKLQEFSLFLGNEFRAVASTGDYDSADPWLESYDVIVATNEKADSLLRHRAGWIDRISLLVADEVHLLGDPERGPTLEMTLTRMLANNPEAQLLALSATAPNAHEIAEWLKAELVSMDWRPVPLREGVYLRGDVIYSDRSVKKVDEQDYSPAISIVLQTVSDGGQAIIFANTRRRAEQYAEKAASALSSSNLLSQEDRDFLTSVASELEQSGEASAFTERVSSLLREGACFHHAGLGASHRRAVEYAFRQRHLKVLCATPTLAAGVNLPARLVVIPELRRYEVGEGLRSISVTEYKQFCGRAGRPGYDEYGEAVSIAHSDDEFDFIFEKYVRGRPERIWSKLASQRHMRIQVLAVLASEEIRRLEELEGFFGRTFLTHQFGGSMTAKVLKEVVGFLVEHDFVKAGGTLEATRLGRRVSELYIDPLTALTILKTCSKRPKNLDELGHLQVVCMALEVPRVPMKRVDAWKLKKFVEENFESFFEVPDPAEDPDGYDLFLDSVKTTILMKAWVDEVSEGELYEKLGVEPGDLAVLRERCSWISYAASQLMAIEGNKALENAFMLLSERLAYGVRAELLPLVSLKGVGRVRARNLYNSGYRSLEDLRKASVDQLAKVPTIGEKTAASIKSQL
ncbi:MAG: DEAD/DEAH box helicase [Candidatus Caldarchaeum sp.]|nr:DEAD/DEAH box helicase [Candidatus Caldarchaeum sp.]